jgi:hypothetical protein
MTLGTHGSAFEGGTRYRQEGSGERGPALARVGSQYFPNIDLRGGKRGANVSGNENRRGRAVAGEYGAHVGDRLAKWAIRVVARRLCGLVECLTRAAGDTALRARHLHTVECGRSPVYMRLRYETLERGRKQQQRDEEISTHEPGGRWLPSS